jgi:CheY-like chemotaxis protein
LKQILFVDDERRILSGLRRQLHGRRDVWEMEFVGDGTTALKRLDEKVFDVVVSDMRMPVVNGVAVLRRAAERNPLAARLMLSGQTEELIGVVPGGAHRFVDKPCPISLVELELEQALSMADMLKGREDPNLRGLWALPLGVRKTWHGVLQVASESACLREPLIKFLEVDQDLFRRVSAAIAEVNPVGLGDDLSPKGIVEGAGPREVLFAALSVEAVDTVLPGFDGPWLAAGTEIDEGRPDGSSLSCLLSPLASFVPDPQGLALLSWMLPGWGFAADALEAVLACTMGSLRFEAHFAEPEGR